MHKVDGKAEKSFQSRKNYGEHKNNQKERIEEKALKLLTKVPRAPKAENAKTKSSTISIFYKLQTQRKKSWR